VQQPQPAVGGQWLRYQVRPRPAIAGRSVADLDAVTGQAAGAAAVGGTAAATLDGATGAALGSAVTAGASAHTLDGATGAASATATNVVTLRQRQGRRDDRDMLMVSGWR
jgi:hypothetical protein